MSDEARTSEWRTFKRQKMLLNGTRLALFIQADRRLRGDRMIINGTVFDVATGQPVPMADAYIPWSEST